MSDGYKIRARFPVVIEPSYRLVIDMKTKANARIVPFVSGPTAQQMGRLRMAKLTPKERTALGKLGAAKRWGAKKKPKPAAP
jgi:hypothetical protein